MVMMASDFPSSARRASGKSLRPRRHDSMISLDLSDEPIASIIILTRDNIDVLGRCLTSLATSIDPQRVPFEVILLFQEMDDSVVRSFLKSTRGLRPLRATLNLGFAAGNNFAARHAKGKYLVFLND